MREGPSDAPTAGATSDEGRALRAGDAKVEALLERWWRDERPAWTDETWWQATLRDDVRRVLWLPPGPDLVDALDSLPRGPVCPLPHGDDGRPTLPAPGQAPGWPCACQVVIAAAWEACAAWVAARCAITLVDAAGPAPVHVDVAGGAHQLHDPARDELAAALRWTIASAGNRITAARAMVAHPRLASLVEAAAISAWSARLVCDHLDGLTADQATRVIDEVAETVHARLTSRRRAYNSADVNRLARAARLRICPTPEKEARIRAWAGRRVLIEQRADGMATLVADLTEADAHRIHRRLSAIASGLQADARADGHPEDRTRDQLRADILADLLLGTAPAAGDGHAADPPPGSPAAPANAPMTRPSPPRDAATTPHADAGRSPTRDTPGGNPLKPWRPGFV